MKKLREPQQSKRLEWWLIDSNEVKTRREEKKTRKKYEKYKFD
jgi:hypothetical protein